MEVQRAAHLGGDPAHAVEQDLARVLDDLLVAGDAPRRAPGTPTWASQP
jgi:hypothetical protein